MHSLIFLNFSYAGMSESEADLNDAQKDPDFEPNLVSPSVFYPKQVRRKVNVYMSTVNVQILMTV